MLINLGRGLGSLKKAGEPVPYEADWSEFDGSYNGELGNLFTGLRGHVASVPLTDSTVLIAYGDGDPSYTDKVSIVTRTNLTAAVGETLEYQSATNGMTWPNLLEVTEGSRYLVAGVRNGDNVLQASLVDVDQETPSITHVVTETDNTHTAIPASYVTLHSSSLFVQLYEDNPNNISYLVAGSISGDTITYNTATAFINYAMNNGAVEALDETYGLVASQNRVGLYSISGTTITMEQTEDIISGPDSVNRPAKAFYKISDTKALFVYASGVDLVCEVITRSGATFTRSSPTTIAEGVSTNWRQWIIPLRNDYYGTTIDRAAVDGGESGIAVFHYDTETDAITAGTNTFVTDEGVEADHPTFALFTDGDYGLFTAQYNTYGGDDFVARYVVITPADSGYSIPGNTALPAISGTPEIGETLTASTGTWVGSPTSYAYQWQRDGVNISGATSSTYTLVSADDDTDITVDVTATNANGSDTASSASVHAGYPAPVNTVAPVASGTGEVGQTLSCTTGTWTGTSIVYTYQWRRDGVDISGATSSSYTLVSADEGTDVDCNVTGTTTGGSASADSNDIAVSGVAIPTYDGFIIDIASPTTWMAIYGVLMYDQDDNEFVLPLTPVDEPADEYGDISAGEICDDSLYGAADSRDALNDSLPDFSNASSSTGSVEWSNSGTSGMKIFVKPSVAKSIKTLRIAAGNNSNYGTWIDNQGLTLRDGADSSEITAVTEPTDSSDTVQTTSVAYVNWYEWTF